MFFALSKVTRWIQAHKRVPVYAFCRVIKILLLLLMVSINSPAEAQIATFTGTAIGSGSSGTYSYSSPNYSVSGAGTGVSGTADSCFFANTDTSGNIEIIAKINSISAANLNPHAAAGLMVRAGTAASDSTAFISVSPGDGIRFSIRKASQAQALTTLGPGLGTPVFLRLVVSGTSVAGYQSSDGSNWKLVGQDTLLLQKNFKCGFCVASGSTQQCTAVFGPLELLSSVPQRDASMVTWLRADAGVITSGSNVLKWIDQSGNGQNATAPATSSNQPTFTSASGSTPPALTFNSANQQYLTFGSGFKDFTQGASIFIVTKPATTATDQRILDLNPAGTGQTIRCYESSATQFRFRVSDSAGTATDANATLAANTVQVFECIHDGTAVATAYTNGVAGTPNTAMKAIGNVLRTDNSIAKQKGAVSTNCYSGTISEIIVYSRILSPSERLGVESYLFSKFGIGGTPQLVAPTITPPNSVAAKEQLITITHPAGAIIKYQINGGTVTTYAGPFTVNSNSIITATASLPGFGTSPTATAQVQIESASTAVIRNGLQLWLRASNGVTPTPTSTAAAVTAWQDLSGNQNNPTPSATAPTTLIDSNGVPQVRFNGTNSFSLPATAAFTSGCSIFVVANPSTIATNKTLIEYGNTSFVGIFRLFEGSASTVTFSSYDSGGNVGSISTGLAANTPQLIDLTFNGTDTGSLFVNSTGATNTAMKVMPSITRSSNSIGRSLIAGAGSTYFYQGDIAEMLVYNTNLTSDQRDAIERYLVSRYSIRVNTPIITPSGGTFTDFRKTVSIVSDPGSTTYYTTDGTDPVVGSSPVYSGPFTISSSTTVKALSRQSFGGGTNSSIAVADIFLDPMAINLPTSNLWGWFRADIGVERSGSNRVSAWRDITKTNDATNTDLSTQPTFIPALPAIESVGQWLNKPNTTTAFANGFSFLHVFRNPGSLDQNFNSFGNITNGVAFTANTNGSSLRIDVRKAGVSNVLAVPTTYGLPKDINSLAEAVQGGGNAVIYLNGKTLATGSLPAPNTLSLTSGTVAYSSVDLYESEILLYSKTLTDQERQILEAYLLHRYKINPDNHLNFSIASGSTLSAPSQVALSFPPGATVRFTNDGSSPTTSSQLYTGPILIFYSQTIKASIFVNGVSVQDATASYTLDPAAWPAPNSSDAVAPRINIQTPTPAQ